MSEIELKPCPFCGGEARTLPGLRRVYCFTATCGAEMSAATVEGAIKLWNTRSQSERVSRLEEAGEVLKRINKVLSFGGSVEIGTELACRISEGSLRPQPGSGTMSWRAHKGTFVCDDHPRLTVRARKFRALEGTAPLCRACSRPMALADPADRRIALRALNQGADDGLSVHAPEGERS